MNIIIFTCIGFLHSNSPITSAPILQPLEEKRRIPATAFINSSALDSLSQHLFPYYYNACPILYTDTYTPRAKVRYLFRQPGIRPKLLPGVAAQLRAAASSPSSLVASILSHNSLLFYQQSVYRYTQYSSSSSSLNLSLSLSGSFNGDLSAGRPPPAAAAASLHCPYTRPSALERAILSPDHRDSVLSLCRYRTCLYI